MLKLYNDSLDYRHIPQQTSHPWNTLIKNFFQQCYRLWVLTETDNQKLAQPYSTYFEFINYSQSSLHMFAALLNTT